MEGRGRAEGHCDQRMHSVWWIVREGVWSRGTVGTCAPAVCPWLEAAVSKAHGSSGLQVPRHQWQRPAWKSEDIETRRRGTESSSYSIISLWVVEFDVSALVMSHMTMWVFSLFFLNANCVGNRMRANTLRFSYILVKKSRRLWTWLWNIESELNLHYLSGLFRLTLLSLLI